MSAREAVEFVVMWSKLRNTVLKILMSERSTVLTTFFGSD